MRKVLLWLVAVVLGVPLLLFGLARGASWYLVNEQAKLLARSLGPQLRLEYAGTESGIGGPIVLRDVRLRPAGVSDEIHIGRVVLAKQTVREWYQLSRLFSEGRLPERLELELESIRVQPDGELAQRLWKAGLWPLVAPYAALGCAESGRFDKATLLELRGPDAYGRFAYDFNPSSGTLNLVWRYAVPQAGSLILDAAIGSTGAPRLPFAIGPDPQLRSLSLVVVDDAFHRRRNELCARRLGMPPEDFAARHADALTDRLAELGVSVGPALKQALRRFSAQGGEVSLSALPARPQPLSAFVPAGRPGWAAEMNLEKRLDGSLVVEEASVAKEHDLAALLARALEAEKNQPDLFRPVPVAEIARYPQRPLRVHTRDRRVFHVYLERFDGQALVLTQHLTGGRASFVLPLAEIEKVYVLH